MPKKVLSTMFSKKKQPQKFMGLLQSEIYNYKNRRKGNTDIFFIKIVNIFLGIFEI